MYIIYLYWDHYNECVTLFLNILFFEKDELFIEKEEKLKTAAACY